MATQHYNLPTISDNQAYAGETLEALVLQAAGQQTDCAMKKIDTALHNLDVAIGDIDTALTGIDTGSGV